MIFMQQKHFNNNPRIYNNHRSTRNTTSNSNRTTRSSNPITRSINNEHLIIDINDNNINNNNNNNNNVIVLNEPVTFRLNKRLTSIGGIFGTFSIIITGALLYAIFTAKTQDKWYYISAVLINIGLLLLLMIGAILFDRYYLKKFPQTLESTTNTRNTNNANNNNNNNNNRPINNNQRTINLNTVLYPTSLQSTLLATESENSIDYFTINNNNRNDIPPQYLDLTNNFIFNKTNKNSIKRSQSSTIIAASSNSDNNNNQIKIDSSSSFLQPPNYFDLYPIKDSNATTMTSSILHS